MYQIGLVFTQKACISSVNLSKKADIAKLHVLPNILPQPAKKIYTDLSVTFRNSVLLHKKINRFLASHAVEFGLMSEIWCWFPRREKLSKLYMLKY